MEQGKCNVTMMTNTATTSIMLAELCNVYYQVTTSIYNLVLGEVYCEHYGTMHIQGSSGYSCKVKFKKQSLMNRNPHQVQYLHIIGVCFFMPANSIQNDVLTFSRCLMVLAGSWSCTR